MRVKFEITGNDLREIIAAVFREKSGSQIPPEQIQVEVKSKQNWKSEWEAADFRAWVDIDL